MRMLVDVKCNYCMCSTSSMWLDPTDIAALKKSHICADGGTSDSFTETTRRVPGPGERLGDERNS